MPWLAPSIVNNDAGLHFPLADSGWSNGRRLTCCGLLHGWMCPVRLGGLHFVALQGPTSCAKTWSTNRAKRVILMAHRRRDRRPREPDFHLREMLLASARTGHILDLVSLFKPREPSRPDTRIRRSHLSQYQHSKNRFRPPTAGPPPWHREPAEKPKLYVGTRLVSSLWRSPMISLCLLLGSRQRTLGSAS